MDVKFRRTPLHHLGDHGKWTQRIKVTKIDQHQGVEFSEDIETGTVAGIGAIFQHTRAYQVEVETE